MRRVVLVQGGQRPCEFVEYPGNAERLQKGRPILVRNRGEATHAGEPLSCRAKHPRRLCCAPRDLCTARIPEMLLKEAEPEKLRDQSLRPPSLRHRELAHR